MRFGSFYAHSFSIVSIFAFLHFTPIWGQETQEMDNPPDGGIEFSLLYGNITLGQLDPHLMKDMPSHFVKALADKYADLLASFLVENDPEKKKQLQEEILALHHIVQLQLEEINTRIRLRPHQILGHVVGLSSLAAFFTMPQLKEAVGQGWMFFDIFLPNYVNILQGISALTGLLYTITRIPNQDFSLGPNEQQSMYLKRLKLFLETFEVRLKAHGLSVPLTFKFTHVFLGPDEILTNPPATLPALLMEYSLMGWISKTLAIDEDNKSRSPRDCFIRRMQIGGKTHHSNAAALGE